MEERIANDPRVRVRKGGLNPQGECVVYWMRRSQRGWDNAALNVAIQAGNLLKKPVVVFSDWFRKRPGQASFPVRGERVLKRQHP